MFYYISKSFPYDLNFRGKSSLFNPHVCGCRNVYLFEGCTAVKSIDLDLSYLLSQPYFLKFRAASEGAPHDVHEIRRKLYRRKIRAVLEGSGHDDFQLAAHVKSPDAGLVESPHFNAEKVHP